MRGRPRRLYARIFVHFLAVVLVVSGVSITIVASGWRIAFLRGATERLTRHIALQLADRIDDRAALGRTARRISDELDLDVTVRSGDGARLLAAGADLPSLSPRDIASLQGESSMVVARGKGRGWFVIAPILDRATGEVRGVLQVAPQHRFRVPGLLRPVLIAVLVLGIVALGTIPLARRISRPVERLTEATRRLGDGDLAHRIAPVEGDDQLAELTRAWNEMAARLEALVRGQKELLANVSHELRSPMARLRMAVELMAPPEGNDELRRNVEDDLGQLDRLIDDLLTSSRLEARGLPLSLGRIDLRATLGELREQGLRDPTLAGRPIEIALPDGDLVVEADGQLVRRALWNLIENAGKHGRPPIEVAVTAGPERVEVAVADHGAGVPPAEREQVFAPFYRSRSSGGRGFGLGLTLARQIAEVHGGRVAVDDAFPGAAEGERGCRVTFTLPRRCAEPAPGKA